MEQLNIVGKRSGNGFVAHKATLVNALGRTLAERLMLLDFTIGRKGLLGYLKSLAGSNIIKILPAHVEASETQLNGNKRLKVVCGSTTGYLDDQAWIGDNTPMTFADIRISPNNAVKPNIGSIELAEALNRVVPFTAAEDNRPVLQCVLFRAKEGKLQMISADGFRLAVVSLDYDEGEGEVLVYRDDLMGIANALRKARRVRLGFENGEDSSLVIDTEAIRYRWQDAGGKFPDYEKLIPTEANTIVHLDTVEAAKAVQSLKAIAAESKDYPVDLHLDNGSLVLSSPDGTTCQVTVAADIEGEPLTVRLNGSYLVQALKACGGMVDLKLTDAHTPTLFTCEGYQLVVMPMLVDKKQGEPETAEAQAEPEKGPMGFRSSEKHVEPEPEATDEPAEAERPKRSRKREPVAVA